MPREIDLGRARSLPTRPCVEYLKDKITAKTVTEAPMKFCEHIKNEETEGFLGEFGEKFENNETYYGFYAFNPSSAKILSSLHSYMRLSTKKAETLQSTHKLLDE